MSILQKKGKRRVYTAILDYIYSRAMPSTSSREIIRISINYSIKKLAGL